MQRSQANGASLSPAQLIFLGFALVILTGAVLLTLPLSVRSGQANNFIDALFTATSAVCVTGLVTVDTGTFYGPFGHLVILILLQIGGLGIVTAATFYALLSGKRIGLKERIIVKEALNRQNLGGVIRLVRSILLATVIIEGIGSFLLFLVFMKYFPWHKALWYGIFHAISAFCNAGFDLLGQDYYPFCSLIPFQKDIIVLIIFGSLVVLGGIGFPVLLELRRVKGLKNLSLHSKIVILVTCLFVLGGTVIFYILERNTVLGGLGVAERLVNAWFLSVVPRTAGFAAVDLAKTAAATWLILMFFMFVGASPASTGGGIKTTTFSILLLAVWAKLRARDDVEVFDRTIDKDSVYRALVIAVLASSMIFLCIVLLTLADDHEPIKLIFEAFSAFGTVGLTTGITPNLSPYAKIVLIFLMFFGRLGPLTVALALLEKKQKTHIKFPKGNVIIG